MRIQFLLTQSLESPSGLGRYGPLARQLARLGHSIELIALHPDWRSLAQRVSQSDGVTIRYVAPMHVMKAGSHKSYYSSPRLIAVSIRSTLALLWATLRQPADVIHIAKPQPMNGLAGWLAAHLSGRALYLDCDDYEAASNRYSAVWQRRIVQWWEDFLPGQVRAVSVNTNFLRQRCELLGVSSGRLRVVPNGFDSARFGPGSRSERSAIRRQWGFDDTMVILYMGSLSLASHPLMLLLDAFVEVRRRLPRAHLWLVGGGEDYAVLADGLLARGLRDCASLAGRVSPDRAAGIYAASDVSVDPVEANDTARARSPLKLVESMACGTPVVTGDVGDRSQILDGGAAGVLVAPGRANSLAEGICAVLEDPSFQCKLVEQANISIQRYRWDKLAVDFASTYAVSPIHD